MKKLIFTTSSNPRLARSIASKSNVPFGKCTIERFADQEILIQVKENVHKRIVYILGSSFPPAENLLELLILIHTIKIHGSQKRVVIIPYFGYAKGDHIYQRGAALPAACMVQIIETAGASKVITIDLHSKRVERFFTIPLVNLTAMGLLAQHVKKLRIKDLTVVSPDIGGVTRSNIFAQVLGVKDIIVIKKYRPVPDRVKVLTVSGNPKGRNIVIVDDMIQSGGTILRAAEVLKKRGAKNIYVAVTHLVSTGPSVPLLIKSKYIKQVFITNTIPPNVKKLPKKFTVVHVDSLIAQAVGESSPP